MSRQDKPHFDPLETERLILRPMLEDDAHQVVSWRNSKHVSSMSIVTSKQTVSIEEHLSWFKKTRNSRIDYIVELKEKKIAIGSVNLTICKLSNFGKCYELGKYIGEQSALGKGYAFEAAKRWVYYAFESLATDCLISKTRSDNEANIKINKRLGFSVDVFPEELGLLPDGFVFMRLTKEQWEQSSIAN